MRIIEELYKNILNLPSTETAMSGPEREAREGMDLSFEEFKASLDDTARGKYITFEEDKNSYAWYGELRLFSGGFVLGAQLMMEIFTGSPGTGT